MIFSAFFPGTDWNLLLSMIVMVVHLAARLGANGTLALQARHYGTLRANLTREEWRALIGIY